MSYKTSSQSNPIGHVTQPYVTGGSVIALKFDKGVILACDTLLSYGGLLKYKDVPRFSQIKNNLVIASTGQYSDFQEINRRLNLLERQSFLYDDNIQFTVKDYSNFLAKIAYEKRNKMNPYYNSTVIAGFQNGQSFLSTVDLYGNYFIKDYIVTGFSKHFGLPLIANYWNTTRTEAECKQIITQIYQVLFLKDCHASDSIQFSVVDENGVRIEKPIKLQTNWSFKEIKGRANQKLWQ